MASKLGFMLSTIFFMFIFLISADMLCISQIKSGLDALATTVGYRIAKEGALTIATLRMIDGYGAELSANSTGSPAIGETYTFSLKKEYKPLILSKNTMVITVTHSTIVGFYDSYY